MRFLCRIGWHRWGKWSPPVITKDGQLAQQTLCKHCLAIKLRFQ